MNKCAYCGGEVKTPHIVKAGKKEEILTCCSEECGKKASAFCKFAGRFLPVFWVCVVISFVLLISSMFAKSYAYTLCYAGLILICLTGVVFPFATSMTFSALGIKKTVILTRSIGVVGLIAVIIMAAMEVH